MAPTSGNLQTEKEGAWGTTSATLLTGYDILLVLIRTIRLSIVSETCHDHNIPRVPPWVVCVFPWGIPQLQSD